MKKKYTKLEESMIQTLENSGVVDYMQYLRSPFTIIWTNLLAGISRGFGIILGMTVVLGVAIWFIARMVNIPLIGSYFEKAQEYIVEYSEQTNYKEEFTNMENLLKEINNSLSKK